MKENLWLWPELTSYITVEAFDLVLLLLLQHDVKTESSPRDEDKLDDKLDEDKSIFFPPLEELPPLELSVTVVFPFFGIKDVLDPLSSTLLLDELKEKGGVFLLKRAVSDVDDDDDDDVELNLNPLAI